MQNRIKEFREDADLSQSELAEAIGVDRQTIMRLENGKTKRVDRQIIDKIAKVLARSSAQLIGEYAQNKIPVVGIVGAGGEVFPIDDLPLIRGADMASIDYLNCETVEAPPESDSDSIVAVRVVNDSMRPFIKPGSVVYYSSRVDGGHHVYIGELCVVKIKDGPVLIKELKRGYTLGHFNLESYNPAIATIEDAELEWAAPVEYIKRAKR